MYKLLFILLLLTRNGWGVTDKDDDLSTIKSIPVNSSEAKSFQEFPEEIIKEIITFVYPSTLGNLRLSNKSFKKIIDDSYKMLNLTINYYNPSPTLELQRINFDLFCKNQQTGTRLLLRDNIQLQNNTVKPKEVVPTYRNFQGVRVFIPRELVTVEFIYEYNVGGTIFIPRQLLNENTELKIQFNQPKIINLFLKNPDTFKVVNIFKSIPISSPRLFIQAFYKENALQESVSLEIRQP